MHRTAKSLTPAKRRKTLPLKGLRSWQRTPRGCRVSLSLTGLTPVDVRAQAGTPEFLAAVLEHLAGDESLLLVFAANASVAPETVAPALALLQQAGATARRR